MIPFLSAWLSPILFDFFQILYTFQSIQMIQFLSPEAFIHIHYKRTTDFNPQRKRRRLSKYIRWNKRELNGLNKFVMIIDCSRRTNQNIIKGEDYWVIVLLNRNIPLCYVRGGIFSYEHSILLSQDMKSCHWISRESFCMLKLLGNLSVKIMKKK